jgi:hypothetical protein
VDIIADIHAEVGDEVTSPADAASVTDSQYGVGEHRLAGHHSRGKGDVGANHGAGSDMNPALAEDGPWREGDAASGTERPKALGETVA